MIPPIISQDIVKPKFSNTNSSVRKINFTSEPFKDEFVPSKKGVHLAPSSERTAFLYDKTLSYEHRLSMAENLPNLLRTDYIELKNGLRDGFLKLKGFITTDSLRHINYPSVDFIDVTNEINAKNLKRILDNKDKLITKGDFKKIYNVSNDGFAKCIANGNLEFFKLFSQETGELKPSKLIFINSDASDTTFMNAKKIGNRTKFFDDMVKFEDMPVFANIGTLSGLGFGDVKTLYSLLKNKKLDGRIEEVTVNGKTKYAPLVNLNTRKSERLLRQLRDRSCIEMEYADNRFGLTRKELEDAFLNGMLDCYTSAVFIGDLDRIYIDMKSDKTKASLNKLLFQKELFNGLTDSNANKTATNQRIKLAWYLAPKTRQAASELVKISPDILAIIDKRQRQEASRTFADSILLPNITSSETENYENRQIKKFFGKLWDIVGYDEYNEALKNAQDTLEMVKYNGIDNVCDKAERDVICNSNYRAEHDFLNFPF